MLHVASFIAEGQKLGVSKICFSLSEALQFVTQYSHLSGHSEIVDIQDYSDACDKYFSVVGEA